LPFVGVNRILLHADVLTEAIHIMTLHKSDTTFEATLCTPIVKNTFITLQSASASASRRVSVPASARLCSGAKQYILHDKLSETRHPRTYSEVSTDVWTECSNEDEDSGYRTPILSDDEDSPYCRLLPTSPSRKPLVDLRRVTDVEPPPPPFMPAVLSTKPMIPKSSVRLSSAAPAFTPLALKSDVMSHDYDHHFAKILKAAVKTMRESELALNVDVSDSLRDCAIVIQTPRDSVPVEEVLELAHHALLDASSKSNCVFVMGFCAQKPFNMCPLGFEATLGVMESAISACWHIFKKGFCRHGDDCRKQHPSCKMSIRVLVETCELNSTIPSICDFKLKVADFVSNVVSAVERTASCAHVAASKGTSKCWSIELTPKADGRMDAEYLLNLAKNTMLSLSSQGQGVYMLGYAEKPFMPKPSGCVVVLGDMAAETHACWDFYSKGFCRKGCDCKWEHSNCCMAVSIMIKPKLQTR